MSLLLLLSTTGCPKPPPEAEIGWLGRMFGDDVGGRFLAVDDEEALGLLDDHLGEADRRVALQGAARVALEGPDFKLNRPQRIAVARPERLRFEVLGLFDVLAALLVSNGDQFAFFDATTGETTRGEMSPDLLWELARLDLDPSEAVDLLLAAPRPSADLDLVAARRSVDGRTTSIFATGAARCPADGQGAACSANGVDARRLFDLGVEVLEFDERGRLRQFEAIGIDRKTRFRAEFDDYEETEIVEASARGRVTIPYPMSIKLHSPRVGAQARFDWQRVGLADGLPARVFDLPEARASRPLGGR